MTNSYFKFKQFTIHQDKCAMKVCTDACLFGAIASKYLQQAGNCLDIGTGTGLLSLMLAQKNKQIFIDAVEINPDAALQARENIAASPWVERIAVVNEDILSFEPAKQYDLIISNPPFFEDDLRSPDKAVNNAKHDDSLSLVHLLDIVNKQLAPKGLFALLLPFHRVVYFIEEAAKKGLHLTRQILVKQTTKHKFFRGILLFNRQETAPQYSEMFIKDTDQQYTPEFAALLKDYYLFL